MTVLFFIYSSCSINNSKSKVVIFVENLKSNSPVNLLLLDTGQVKTIDSIIPGDKRSEFIEYLEYPMLFFIQNQDKRIEFIAHPSDSITVDFNKKIIAKTTNKENTEFNEFIQTLESVNAKADSLSHVFIRGQSTDSFANIREQVNRSFELFVYKFKLQAISYINANPTSIGIFRAINCYIKQTPVFNYTVDYDWFHKVDSLLTKSYPTHPYTISFHNQVRELSKNFGYKENKVRGIQPGDTLPVIQLTSLNKKQMRMIPDSRSVTLIYLWDKSPKSRQANLAVKQLHEEFKQKGLKIFAIAFDENIKRWSSVIVLDKMWWNNMIDTTGYNSTLLNQLKNPVLPYYILIDRNGIVLSAQFNSFETKDWLRNYYKTK